MKCKRCYAEADKLFDKKLCAECADKRKARQAAEFAKPRCLRCNQSAAWDSQFCGTHRHEEEQRSEEEARRSEAADLTQEFHDIGNMAEGMYTWASLTPRDVLGLVERLARAMAQAREG